MKICFLGPANSAHIVKWSNYFTSHGHEVHVISFTRGQIPGTNTHYIDCGAEGSSSDAKKLNYLFKAGSVRKIIQVINPDIVNAHYATSYGTVAALAGLKNYVLSVWGSDIYDFPNKSPMHRALLKYSLKKAPHLFSTSRAMADEAAKYTKKHFEITPFGVDVDLFSPEKRNRNDSDFVIGTVKALSYKYGIDYLLKAAEIIHREHPEIPLRVRIAGKGPDETAFKELSNTLGLSDIVTWLGFITQEQAAGEWANMDLGVVCSTLESESFGVSAVEAQASACPIIVSDIPGLMEATKPDVSSVVVSRKNEKALADAIVSLFRDREKRFRMGKAGRQYVIDTYEYNHCFDNIRNIFEKIRTEKDEG